MEPNQIIADLIQAHGGLCVLDKIHLPYAQASSGPAAKFGLGCELYLPNIDRALMRERTVQFLGDYHRLFPDKVNEFLPREQRRTVKFKDDPTPRILADCEKYSPDTGYSTSLFGAVDIGLPKDDVPPYQAHVLVEYDQSVDLSFVAASMQICNDGGETNFKVLLSAVLRWCEICQPVHGCAGFALIFASGMSQNTTYALQLMKRFPGFDYVNGVDFSLRAKSTHDRIKCINWLTVLGDAIVAELGGIDAMRAALEPSCKIHVYPGGVVIQAGEEPHLGDTQAGVIPEAYRMAARYTKAVRFENYSKDGLFRVSKGLDKIAETLAWIRRFD